jgi:hypothetical protein
MNAWNRLRLRRTVLGVKTALQLVVVILFATWIFDVSDAKWSARLLLVYPIFPGAVAGLALSGYGGNDAVALTTALVTNSLIWSAAWLGLRTVLAVLSPAPLLRREIDNWLALTLDPRNN